MTTLQIDSNDSNVIEALLDVARKKFNLNIKVINESQNIEPPKNKWAKVADEMRGTMSPETVQYLQECSREVRENFELRDITTSH